MKVNAFEGNKKFQSEKWARKNNQIGKKKLKTYCY